MRFFKEMRGWTEGHHVIILICILACVGALFITMVAHRNGKIELLETQLEECKSDLSAMQLLCDGLAEQIAERDAELVELQDALNRMIGAP